MERRLHLQFYTGQLQYYCGIDLHARTLYACIIDSSGAIVAHRNRPSAPEPLLDFIAPYRSNVVIGVECLFTWYWLADLYREKTATSMNGVALGINHTF